MMKLKEPNLNELYKEEASCLSATRSLIELNPRNSDSLQAFKPRHSTVSAFVCKANAQPGDTNSSTSNELIPMSGFEHRRTVINAIMELKNEIRYCACGSNNARKVLAEESMARSASQMANLGGPDESTSSHQEGESASRTQSAISAIRRRRRKSSGVPSRLPVWRRQLRSRVFRTTLLIITVHVLLWLPYNAFALTAYVNEELFMQLNEQGNILKQLQFLIVLANPLLYGVFS
jgi:hypothetical protein